MEQYNKQKFYEYGFSSSSYQEGKVIHDIHRGEIYYYQFTGKEVGNEISGTTDRRPCVIVSNNKANAFTGLVTVVPMTSKEKSPIPTRVPYEGKTVHGTFLCEQVITISNERLLNFCGEVDEETMKKIDAALCVQLALVQQDNASGLISRQEEEVRSLKREILLYKKIYFELIGKLANAKIGNKDWETE